MAAGRRETLGFLAAWQVAQVVPLGGEGSRVTPDQANPYRIARPLGPNARRILGWQAREGWRAMVRGVAGQRQG